MAVQRTLSIIKPDATRRNLTGAINKRFEEAGLAIVGQRRVRLTEAQRAPSTRSTKNAPSTKICAPT